MEKYIYIYGRKEKKGKAPRAQRDLRSGEDRGRGLLWRQVANQRKNGTAMIWPPPRGTSSTTPISPPFPYPSCCYCYCYCYPVLPPSPPLPLLFPYSLTPSLFLSLLSVSRYTSALTSRPASAPLPSCAAVR